MKPNNPKLRGKPYAALSKLPKPVYLIIGGVLALIAVTALCMKIFPISKPEARYGLETAGGKIDFNDPEIKLHTAADGVAVIGASKPDTDISPVPVSSAPDSSGAVSGPGKPARPVTPPAANAADAAAIPPEEATATHSGFTLPVPMDDESLGILTIPAIALSVHVYESENDMEDMERGAAHFKSTSSWTGNVGIV